MTALGHYGDGRTYSLPDDWTAASSVVLQTATKQALAALTGRPAIDGVARYYDRLGSYAGTLFLDVEPNEAYSIGAADLYALTTLSIALDARQGRLLLDEGAPREAVHRQLHGLHPRLGITELDQGEGGSAATLTRMYALHAQLRDLLPGNSNRWVTAAKLCARKRPSLFPVRDNLVCEYLAAGRALKRGDGWPGDFSVDLQMYAFLMTSPEVVSGIAALREELTDVRGIRLDAEDLRLLDSALWKAAVGAGG